MKTFVTQCDRLDIRQLSRKGFLYQCTKYEWVWRDKGGAIKGAMAVAVLKDRLLLSYRQAGNLVSEKVSITYSTGVGGGQRLWFRCPVCMRRVAILYKNGVRFGCGQCSGLVYPSQYPARSRSYGRRCVAWKVDVGG
jgi:hypothetical protein